MLDQRKKVRLIPTSKPELDQRIETNSFRDQEDPQITLLYRAIAQLSPIDRAIIMLYLDKNDHATIAEVVGLTATNVGVKINRIKKKLKQITDEILRRDLG